MCYCSLPLLQRLAYGELRVGKVEPHRLSIHDRLDSAFMLKSLTVTLLAKHDKSSMIATTQCPSDSGAGAFPKVKSQPHRGFPHGTVGPHVPFPVLP